MFRLDQALKIYLHREPIDFRLNINGLALLVEKALGLDPFAPCAYSPSRSTQAARTLYEGMQPAGVLMSDGYEPYAAIAEQHRLVHLGCWAHCRRYFNDALQALP